jgi:hypothetical protein
MTTTVRSGSEAGSSRRTFAHRYHLPLLEDDAVACEGDGNREIEWEILSRHPWVRNEIDQPRSATWRT